MTSAGWAASRREESRRALLVPLASLEDVQNDQHTGGLIPREADPPAADTQAIFGGLLARDLDYVALTGFRKPENGGNYSCAGRSVEPVEISMSPRRPVDAQTHNSPSSLFSSSVVRLFPAL